MSDPGRGALGLVLCGGRSERLGRDKALVPWAGGDLLDHAVARLAAVVPEVAILCGPSPRYADRGRPVVLDRSGGDGPISGLEAGLAHAAGRPVLLLAVDLPLAPIALLRALVDTLAGLDAVVPASPRGPEPLCASYGPGCLAAIAARLAKGERRMTAFWPDVRVRELRGPELARFGDPEAMFLNVNEEADLARARVLG